MDAVNHAANGDIAKRDIVIRVEGLSKKYLIGHQRPRMHGSIGEQAMQALRGLCRRLRHPLAGGGDDTEEFWALRDVGFEVARGERLGILGRNGAGKSTLLKLLSRITEPTAGRFSINGRVASLLEVGTGFHQELTGRENIYLNGAILGMRRAEIARRFDEIVAFAEVERFLDTPVKRYSSGMYVRLAFAVAAHLDPEIMIVDEVLAVGDAAFQRKCLGKMGEAGKEGRTVIFVSHNVAAVAALCQRGIVLDQGRVVLDAAARDAIGHYLSLGAIESPAEVAWEGAQAPGDEQVALASVALLDGDGGVSGLFDRRQPIAIRIEYATRRRQEHPLALQVRIYDQARACVFMDRHMNQATQSGAPARFASTCTIPARLMNTGRYFVDIHVTTPETRTQRIHVESALSFDVVDGDADGLFADVPGAVRPELHWQSRALGDT